jgi:hypothetical protein
MAELDITFDVRMFVNPETREVDEMYAYHSFGISRRENGTWAAYTREDSNLDELTDHIEYDLNWDTDYLANEDAGDDFDEHAAVLAFDAGTLDEAGVKEYGTLVYDPASNEDDAVFED